MRKTFVPAIVLAVSALAGAGFAAAEGPGAPPPGVDGPMGGPHGEHGFMHHWRPGAHLEGRLAFLKTELAITPAQQKAWDDFAAAAHKSVKITQDAFPAPEAGKDHKEGWRRFDQPVPARLDRAEKMMTAHLEALKAISGPTKALYAALDDTQKKTADELFHGPMAIR